MTKMRRKKLKKPTVATLFAGCGGDSLGFVKAKFELVYANDNNLDACDTLRNRFENTKKKSGKIVHHGNVQKIENFPSANVITGGFPCQGFSLAGPRKVEDRRNTLYNDLKRAIASVKPEFFVAENVKGFVTIGEKSNKKFFNNGKIVKLGEVAQGIVDELSDIGYKVDYKLHNARDYGLPQDRERIIIVGVRNNLVKKFKFKFPTPTHGKNPKDFVSMKKYGVHKIKFNKQKDVFREKKGKRKDYFSSRYMSRNRIRKWKEKSFTIPADASQVPVNPKCSGMWIPHRARLIEKNRPKDSDWAEFRKKYDKDIAKDLVRMSWRQCAAIQGFPPDYPFSGDDIKSVYRQIGNAVPPPLMEKVAKCIMAYFEGKKSSY